MQISNPSVFWITTDIGSGDSHCADDFDSYKIEGLCSAGRCTLHFADVNSGRKGCRISAADFSWCRTVYGLVFGVVSRGEPALFKSRAVTMEIEKQALHRKTAYDGIRLL